MKPTLLLLFMLFFASLSAQQTIYFTYDNAGNQIKRSFDSPFVIGSEEGPDEEPLPMSAAADFNFSYYPNPTQGLLYMDWIPEEENHLTSVKLVNPSGQLLSFRRFNETDITHVIDFGSYADGLYFIILENVSGETQTLKIIKN